MPAPELQDLFKRLAAAEQELAATRTELAIRREISGTRHYRHRAWLAAIVAGGVISAIAFLPIRSAKAQAPSTVDSQLQDLTNRVTALENVKTENLSERIRKISDHVDDLTNRVTALENVKTENISERIRRVSDRVDDLNDRLQGVAEELTKDIARVNARIDALALQSGAMIGSPHKISAPFTVVDASGGAIFQVVDGSDKGFRGAFVFNKSNAPVASMEVNPDGIGAVRARASSGEAVLFAEQGIGGVLRVRGQNGKVVGEVTENGFNYFGSGGNSRALSRLTEEDGKGVVGAYGTGGLPVAILTESKNGGGNVTINDPGGSGVFSAGYVGGGANACIDLPKSGLKCFGIGLPMTFSVQK